MARPKKAITKAQIRELDKKRKVIRLKHLRYSNNPYAHNVDYIPHKLDDDILVKLRSGSLSDIQSDLYLSPDSPNFDGPTGHIFEKWQNEDIKHLWFGILERSLKQLRTGKFEESNAKEIEENIEWFTTRQFEKVCTLAGYQPDQLRRLLADILIDMDVSFHASSIKIIQNFRKIELESNHSTQFDPDMY